MGQRALFRWDRPKEKVRLRKWHFDPYAGDLAEMADDYVHDEPDFKERDLAALRQYRQERLRLKNFDWSDAAG